MRSEPRMNLDNNPMHTLDSLMQSIEEIIDSSEDKQVKTYKLIRAIWHKKPYDYIESIITTDLNFELPDAIGCTALGQALTNNDTQIVKLLLEKGANPNTKSRGSYPIFYAIENGNEQALKLLVEFGANLDVIEKDNNPLLHSLGYNTSYPINEQIFKLLVDLGCDLNYKNSEGVSVLVVCAFWDMTGLIEYMIAKSDGSDLNKKLNINDFDQEEHNGIKYNFPVFYYVCANSNEQLAKLLIESGVEYSDVLNMVSRYGEKLVIPIQVEQTNDLDSTYMLEKQEDGYATYVLKTPELKSEPVESVETIDFTKIVDFATEMVNKYKIVS